MRFKLRTSNVHIHQLECAHRMHYSSAELKISAQIKRWLWKSLVFFPVFVQKKANNSLHQKLQRTEWVSECEACTKNEISAVQPSEIRNQHQRSSAIGRGTQAQTTQTNQVVEIMKMDKCHVYTAQVSNVAYACVILWRNAIRNNDEPFL